MSHPFKRVCERCGWKGYSDAILTAPSPFDPQDTLYACPVCKNIGTTRTCCDEPLCWEQDTIGTPIPGGYRRTCHNHQPL